MSFDNYLFNTLNHNENQNPLRYHCYFKLSDLYVNCQVRKCTQSVTIMALSLHFLIISKASRLA
jgi:hypothetical protein